MAGSLFLWEPLPSAPVGRSHLPQGDGFSGGGKVSSIAIRRPLGGAGCERSEQTEGVLSRSAALSQKAALQMPFAVTTSPVKMRLERSAERDKREI